MGTAIKHPVPEAVICNFWHPGTLTLSPERQSARMSKITNGGLTRSGTGCFVATVGVKGLTVGLSVAHPEPLRHRTGLPAYAIIHAAEFCIKD